MNGSGAPRSAAGGTVSPMFAQRCCEAQVHILCAHRRTVMHFTRVGGGEAWPQRCCEAVAMLLPLGQFVANFFGASLVCRIDFGIIARSAAASSGAEAWPSCRSRYSYLFGHERQCRVRCHGAVGRRRLGRRGMAPLPLAGSCPLGPGSSLT